MTAGVVNIKPNKIARIFCGGSRSSDVWFQTQTKVTDEKHDILNTYFLLEKLTSLQLVKKFPAFYGT